MMAVKFSIKSQVHMQQRVVFPSIKQVLAMCFDGCQHETVEFLSASAEPSLR